MERTRVRTGRQHAAMTFSEYRAINATNWGTLKRMGKSALAYHDGLTAPDKETPAMAAGRLFHTATLEPDRLPLEYAIWDGGRRGTNDYKAFVEQQGTRQIVTAAEYANALAVRDAVHAHKRARRLLRYGRPEVTLQWVDPETHIRCKARLDWLRGDVFTDLKSTTDIDARTFGRTAQRLGYHCQLAFYRMGLLATGHGSAPVRIIAVEADEPHDVAVFTVDEDVLFVGELEVRSLLRRLKDCRRKRRWPGRYPDEVSLEFPTWALPSDSDYSDISDLGIAFEVRGETP
jgi:hypothetical protein